MGTNLFNSLKGEITFVKNTSEKIHDVSEEIVKYYHNSKKEENKYAGFNVNFSTTSLGGYDIPMKSEDLVGITSDNSKPQLGIEVLLTILQKEVVAIKISASKLEDISDTISKSFEHKRDKVNDVNDGSLQIQISENSIQLLSEYRYLPCDVSNTNVDDVNPDGDYIVLSVAGNDTQEKDEAHTEIVKETSHKYSRNRLKSLRSRSKKTKDSIDSNTLERQTENLQSTQNEEELVKNVSDIKSFDLDLLASKKDEHSSEIINNSNDDEVEEDADDDEVEKVDDEVEENDDEVVENEDDEVDEHEADDVVQNEDHEVVRNEEKEEEVLIDKTKKKRRKRGGRYKLKRKAKIKVEEHENEKSTHDDSDSENDEDDNEAKVKPFKCEQCEKYFASKPSFRRHRKTQHTNWKEERVARKAAALYAKEHPAVHQCEHCGREFSCKSRLVIHVRTHTGENPFKCEVCERCFRHKATWVRHMRTHNNERPYICDLCGKGFFDKKELLCHQRRHTGDRPYPCSQCDQRFYLNNELKIHIRRKHTGEKPFQCEECGKRFYDTGKLARHRKIHTGDITCPTCSKTFQQNYHLIAHLRTHTGEKPFNCEECGMCFTSAGSVKRHMMIHTGEKPFKCSECGMSFNQNSILQGHIKNRHSGKNRMIPQVPLPTPLPQSVPAATQISIGPPVPPSLAALSLAIHPHISAPQPVPSLSQQMPHHNHLDNPIDNGGDFTSLMFRNSVM